MPSKPERPARIFKQLWSLKLLAKIKIFLWLVMWKRTMNKDNLGKRGWEGATHSMFHAVDERIDHLFQCPVARFVWGIFQCAFDFPSPPHTLDDLGCWIIIFQGCKRVAAKTNLADVFWAIWKKRNKYLF